MTQRIKHIDKIAREKNRTVLFVSFEPLITESDQRYQMLPPNHFYRDFENDTNRQQLISWLNDNKIEWVACGHIASESGWQAYSGNIYIDVPLDETDSQFVKLQNHLETPEGEPRNPQVKLWAYDISDAMKNAHHDEPGFWAKWAENF